MTSKEIAEQLLSQLLSLFNEREEKRRKVLFEYYNNNIDDGTNKDSMRFLKYSESSKTEIDKFHCLLSSWLWNLYNWTEESSEELLEKTKLFFKFIKTEHLDSDIQQFIKTRLTNN